MRLIDADAFKYYFWNAYEIVKHTYPDGGDWAMGITEQLCEDIDKQPTIVEFDSEVTKVVVKGEEYCKRSQWIPCSERLPEEDKEVMVSVHFLGFDQKHPSGWNDHIKENYYVDVGSQIDGEWSSYSDEYKVARNRHVVVAWMPLPEPYNKE